mmetsp:Transcript_40443/g.88375  ORF Transcript_40443/g.88375 Transcript_40443/m.88375 type:complete len:266 (-) Transcript_40443:143-940(-)
MARAKTASSSISGTPPKRSSLISVQWPAIALSNSAPSTLPQCVRSNACNPVHPASISATAFVSNFHKPRMPTFCSSAHAAREVTASFPSFRQPLRSMTCNDALQPSAMAMTAAVSRAVQSVKTSLFKRGIANANSSKQVPVNRSLAVLMSRCSSPGAARANKARAATSFNRGTFAISMTSGGVASSFATSQMSSTVAFVASLRLRVSRSRPRTSSSRFAPWSKRRFLRPRRRQRRSASGMRCKPSGCGKRQRISRTQMSTRLAGV